MPAEQYHDFPLSDNYQWDADSAEPGLRRWASSDGSGDKEKIDWAKLKKVYFWHDSGELRNFEQLKFPYCRIENDEPHVVHNAVQNALARIDGSNIPDDEKDDVRKVAQRQMDRFNNNSNRRGRPTQEQLDKINKFTVKKLNADEVYVFKDMMIDNQETSYNSKIHENLLRKFMVDTKKGIALLTGHDDSKLPVGRSFDAYIMDEYDDELQSDVLSLYGEYYIDMGRKTESGMSTDDIAKAIDAGTVFDTSIGFQAESFKCSICGNDIRNWMACPHIPGKKYAVNRNGEDVVEKCIVIIGEDGVGELVENSLVYAGACGRATIKNNFSVNNVKDDKNGTNLQLVNNIKDIPLGVPVYQYYQKGKWAFYVDSNEFNRRSGGKLEIEKIIEVLKEFGIKTDSVEDIKQSLKSKEDRMTQLNGELETVKNQFETVKTELEKAKTSVSELTDANEKLKVTNQELAKKAEIADAYRKDLIDKAVEFGIRANGNAFNEELFRKYLETLSLDEIKNAISNFESAIKAKFGGARITDSSGKETRDKNVVSRDSFETEDEFREFVAEEAVKYAKENNVSISEATKIVYKKYLNGSEK